MTATHRLALPLLAAGQAQKHVTLNDALLRLDALVQLAVADRHLAVPPVSAAVGEAWIVAAGASGDWAGQVNRIAVREEAGWRFEVPLAGWRAHVLDEGTTLVWTGTAWVSTQRAIQAETVGVNATADSANRLSVSAAATLLSHEGAGHQLKLNKAGVGATGSLLFQTAFSGRAEMGLAGSDAFSIKVSADGSSWQTGFTLDPLTGRATFPADLTLSGHRIGSGPGGVGSNCAFGAGALNAATGGFNVAMGQNAALLLTSASQCVAIGRETLRSNLTGANNTAVGAQAGYTSIGSSNVFVGFAAAVNAAAGGSNTGVGANCLASVTTWSNCAALGRNADVTGANQVQLGDSATTVYAYGAVQNRSDARDKADIRDTVLGLDFILKLRPRDWRWDLRDDYRDSEPSAEVAGGARPNRPAERRPPRRLADVTRSGTARRQRYHHGLVAQEVRQAMADLGVDFGGLQDHALSGGDEVLTLGYSELIGPLVKAVQELAGRIEVLAAARYGGRG
jgi:hypothetical protein